VCVCVYVCVCVCVYRKTHSVHFVARCYSNAKFFLVVIEQVDGRVLLVHKKIVCAVQTHNSLFSDIFAVVLWVFLNPLQS
jgi:hypothetical protein